jgi:hypothetical protein
MFLKVNIVRRTKKIIYTLQIALVIHVNCKKRSKYAKIVFNALVTL